MTGNANAPAPTAPVARRPSVAWNVVANYAGNLWTAAAALACIPLYVHFMGISAYGLVGFYVALQAIISLLDAGLSTTLNRELARLTGAIGKAGEMGDLVRTLEVVYWAIAVCVAGAIALLAPLISTGWIHGGGLSVGAMTVTVILIGFAIALEFPFVLYSGGLMGLQRQVALNVLVVVFASLRSFGSVLVLWLVSPTIEAFFIWQAIVSVLQSGAAGVVLWNRLPRSNAKPRLQFKRLKSIARFSTEIGAIGILSALLTQLPRLELSKLLTLREFGYFSLAVVAVTGLYYLVTPIFQAVFPRLTQMAESGRSPAKLYHQASQAVSVVVLPVSLLLALFSKQIVLLWTGSSTTAGHVGVILTLLTIGTAFHCLYWMPYALQLGYKWSSLALYQNSAAVLVLAPLTLFLSIRLGASGAAIAWIILCAGYLAVGVQLMHRRLLTTEKWAWYLEDVLFPAMAAAAIVVPGRLLVDLVPGGSTNPWMVAPALLVIGSLAIGASVLACGWTRSWAVSAFRRRPSQVSGRPARLVTDTVQG